MTISARPASFFDAAGPRLFSVDQGRPFLEDLAEGLIEALGFDLPRAEIFFPTRRAVRAAGDAILDAYERRGVGAALLPRFRAIGDIDEDELAAFAGEAADELDLPPAVSPTERMVTLARLVAARDRAFAGHENWPAAIAAARELGRLLDHFYTEEIDPSAMATLDVSNIANHWAKSLEFLDIVTRYWPEHLQAIGRADPAARRAALISSAATRFATAPPAHPLIIAGTTGSAPAVSRLVDAIARAPRWLAILPGLDRAMDERAWEAVDDAHPQSGLKALLERLNVPHTAVRAWAGSGEENSRARLLTLALRPAEATDEWLSLVGAMTKEDKDLAASTRGMSLIEADNEEAEASIIAALFRMTVEEPEKTAILVTPDRQLSRRVALKMRRWNILVDDSAGVPFANSSCGLFLRLTALFLEDPGDPVVILALLRHPLTRLGLESAERARAVDAIDRALRGTRPANGLASVEAMLRMREPVDTNALSAIAALNDAASQFPRDASAPFGDIFAGHINAAERLSGVERLWSGDDGEAGAMLLADLQAAANDITAIGGRRYADVFSALIAGAAVRQRSTAHPRLSILGPLEARLQSADRIILGGLNEGVWPQGAAGDPFLSRKMRKDLGLPSPERRIGLSAHDFAGLAAQKEIIMTRAKRSGGSPATASRWIVRLKNILTGAGALSSVDRSDQWRAIIAKLEDPGVVKAVDRPTPKAGPGRRPSEVSVTRVEKWLRDPYSIYAMYLLRLKKLEDPGIVFGPREMGTLLHKVFELAALAEKALAAPALQSLYDELAPEYGLSNAERRFWSAAVADSFEWFEGFDAERRKEGALAIAEGSGSWTVNGVSPPFTLTAIADRIDLLTDGRVALFDYKSGKLRTEKKDVTFSPQLALTGAMIRAGAFEAIGAREIARYEYLKSLGRDEDERKNGWGREGADAADSVRDAEDRLRALVSAYDNPQTVYHSQPRPEFIDDYGDYDQLARRKEWGAAGDGGEGGGE
ncbi:MAG: double-strand break repair protein AddB [Pseudomonadota bacterium]